MNKETFAKLKAEKKAKPKVARDPFKFLREWLTSKPATLTAEQRVANKRKEYERFAGIRLGNKKLFGNVVLRMQRRGLSLARTEFTKHRIEKDSFAEYRNRFTRRQWREMHSEQIRLKNKENGLNRFGFPVRDGFKGLTA